ncbi:MAG TPA: ABC transporter substrate-binding protein [Acidimicrobiia bacterium]
MAYRTLRTIGASVVLAGVVVAGVAQIGAREPVDTDIVTRESSTTMGESPSTALEVTTTIPAPFVYRVGVLSGVSTDNFWAFYGREPSVWNSYVLGPTKPALYTARASLGSLQPEFAIADVEPREDDNGWSVVVDLNPDLAWSDGVPVTAHDLVFTFETVRGLKLGGSWADSFPKPVKSIEADGDYRVRIGFSERPQLSVWPYGVGLAPIMAKHMWDGVVADTDRKSLYELSGSDDVSGGPLTIDLVTENLIVSTPNRGYPAENTPDTVEYHVYDGESAALDALEGGEVDSLLSPRGLTVEQTRAVEKVPSIELVHSPGNAIRYLGFNIDRDPMSNQAFRMALALLVDRERLAQSIPGTGSAAWSLVPEANSQWFDDEAAAGIRQKYQGSLQKRLESALVGLQEAGYAWDAAPSVDQEGKLVAGSGLTIDGQTPQPLTILTPGDNFDPARPLYVESIAETLAVLGFDARPVETDFDTVIDLAFTPGEDGQLHYDMYVLGWTLGNPALPMHYGALFGSDAPMNNTGYQSEAFEEALAAYEGAFTRQKAKGALWQVEAVLANDLPYLPLYTSEITEAYRGDRVRFDLDHALGGLHARLGGIWDVEPAD